MVNSRVKGRRIENLGLALLQKQGWYLEARAPGTTKFNKRVDLCYGLFDAILHRRKHGTKHRLYVQFKAGRKPVFTEYRKFLEEQCDDRDFVAIFVYKARQGFKQWWLHYDFENISEKIVEPDK